MTKKDAGYGELLSKRLRNIYVLKASIIANAGHKTIFFYLMIFIFRIIFFCNKKNLNIFYKN